MKIELNNKDIELINELFKVANCSLDFAKIHDNTITDTIEEKQKELFNLKNKINNQIK